MDKQLFEDEIKEVRRKHLEPVVNEVLALMLSNDIKVGDAAYTYNRTLEIIKKTLEKMNFKSKEIEEKRRAFLDVLIDGMQQSIYGFDDEMLKLKKDIKSKDKEKKRKAVERLTQLERVNDGKPKDLTEERYCECEPVAQEVAKKLLSADWLLKDDNYITKAIEFDNELLVAASAYSAANVLFEQIGYDIERHYANANAKFWNNEKRNVRMSDIDKKLKE